MTPFSSTSIFSAEGTLGNPGMVMNTIALLRENPDPTDEEIAAYLAGNLCRCSGYDGQLRGIRGYLNSRKKGGDSHGA